MRGAHPVSAMFESTLAALQVLFTPGGALFLFVGVVIGLLFGVMPGLGGTTAIALLMPLTFSHGIQPCHGADRRHHGRGIGRRLDLGDPAQHAGHRAERGDLFRRLSAGAAGQGRTRDRRGGGGLHARRTDRRGRADRGHSGDEVDRAAVRPAGILHAGADGPVRDRGVDRRPVPARTDRRRARTDAVVRRL